MTHPELAANHASLWRSCGDSNFLVWDGSVLEAVGQRRTLCPPKQGELIDRSWLVEK